MQHDCTLILMLKRQPLIGEKDTVAFFLREWVENWLFTVNRNVARSSSAREGGRNGKISRGGVWAEDWELWGKMVFVSREALSGTVPSGHVWPANCVTCLPKSKTSDENSNIRVLICYLCVFTPASDSTNHRSNTAREGKRCGSVANAGLSGLLSLSTRQRNTLPQSPVRGEIRQYNLGPPLKSSTPLFCCSRDFQGPTPLFSHAPVVGMRTQEG